MSLQETVWGRKGLCCFRTFRSSLSLRSPRAGTEADAIEEGSLLACSLKLTQPALLYNSGPQPRIWQCPEWAGLSTSVFNQENTHIGLPVGNLDMFSQLRLADDPSMCEDD